MKILAPAGNFDCLKAAIFNGADEVYLGINQFNARNNVDGFTLDNLGEAVDFAHVFGVKVHLAINILFSNDEIPLAVETAVKAFNLGVDAFIIQDLGLASILHRDYPNMELHASTQMGIHNLEGVKFIEKFGFKRVVLARETPLEEIRRINKNSDIEIEYFAHGALCVSFSGNCYLSSYTFDASGNRGKCKQLCRLPYRLEKDGKTLKSGYLLSAKDFNMTDKLAVLKDAGVDVIKIEGRARRPFYVATATSQYKLVLNNKDVDENLLKLAFNREFTRGYFDGNGSIISFNQNHQGVFIGKVKRVNKGKTFSEVFFDSKFSLSPKSSFKVFGEGREKSVFTAYDLTKVNGEYRVTTTQNVDVGDGLNLIVDARKETEVLLNVVRRRIELNLNFEIDKNACAFVEVDGKTEKVFGEILSAAQKQPLSELEIKENFKKSDLFDANIKIGKLERVFLSKKQLNEFRRKVFETARNMLTQPYHHNVVVKKLSKAKSAPFFRDFQVVDNLNEQFNAKNIIYSPETYVVDDVVRFMNKCSSQKKNAYLDTPIFALEKDVELLNNVIDKTRIGCVANNYYAFSLNNVKVIGGGLNVYNEYTAEVHGLAFVSAEGDFAERVNQPYMTLRHCPMKNHLKANCFKCPYTDGYRYVMESGKVLKLKRKKLHDCTFYLTD